MNTKIIRNINIKNMMEIPLNSEEQKYSDATNFLKDHNKKLHIYETKYNNSEYKLYGITEHCISYRYDNIGIFRISQYNIKDTLEILYNLDSVTIEYLIKYYVLSYLNLPDCIIIR